MKIEIDLPTIEGYEFTGECRIPKHGDFIFHLGDKKTCTYGGQYLYKYLILRKLEDPKLPEKFEDMDGGTFHLTGEAEKCNKIIDYLKHLKDEINTLKENK